ncbi:MAG: trypsin-like peptidase domain-containing protein [Nitrososphaerota archaeon]|nr:trypsin-like peptidase domain-containing protein [Nitrososphaerota archaeon]MDG6921950.1 trypsin-like peptidase domain-containing protein [Nitrososphaerota archaeon]
MSAIELQAKVVESVEKLNKSVVSVDSVRLERNFRYGVVPREGQGSGIIIDPKGYIITNNHVIEGASRVQVHLEDGRSFEGEVMGSDQATDVALIRVNTSESLPTATLGNSDELKVGQFALAIGNALGLPGGSTASLGLIGALGRPLPWAEFIFEGLIQTDAAINPGNSGGPLADINGNVIGINTAMVPFAQGVGFAIPINAVKRVVEQIFTNGRVIRPWLGISGLNMTPQIARRYNLQSESGVLVAELSREGPAYEAGLRSNDIVVQVAGQEIKNMKDLLVTLSKNLVGSVVRLQFIRMGRRGETSLRLVEVPLQMQNYIRGN